MTARQQELFAILSGPPARKGRAVTSTVQTEWAVVTGAPGSGKSTICDELAKAGHKIVPEASRTAIIEAEARGFSHAEIFAHPPLLAEAIMNRKLALAGDFSPSEPWVWDTGLIDALVFCRMAEMDLTLFAPALLVYRFRSVVVLDPLAQAAVQGDPVRPQTERVRLDLDKALRAEYAAQGYRFAAVRSGELPERVKIVRSEIA